MEKKTLLGVQTKRPIKPRNKKKLLQKVIDYLISDSYMFAPLISDQPHSFNSPRKTRAALPGVGLKKPTRVNNKRLVNKVADYLKSDSYMYAPLLAPPPPITTSSPPKGSSQHLKRVITVAVSKSKLILEDNKTNGTVAKGIAEGRVSKGCLPEPVMHKETVKHAVNHSCRSSAISGKGTLSSQLRKLVD